MYINSRLGLVESVETMLVQEMRLNLTANNLANVDSAGYKKDQVSFREMLYTASNRRQRVGKMMHSYTDHAQGTMEQTGNPLDLAISGAGYFKVQTPGGVRYTRNGNFYLNNQGQMTTADGYPVFGPGGPIVLEEGIIDISKDGRISVNGEEANRLAVVDFQGPDRLKKEGFNLFKLREDGGQEKNAEDFEIQQGFLESSNVNSINEMTNMIDINRFYENQQKVIRLVDYMNDQAVTRVGRLS